MGTTRKRKLFCPKCRSKFRPEYYSAEFVKELPDTGYSGARAHLRCPNCNYTWISASKAAFMMILVWRKKAAIEIVKERY